jgi:glycosyltransferase involved in cell wall biosynthesis
MTKTVLISHLPLPYDKIGSWTTLYDNFITSDLCNIDIIICPKGAKVYEYITYLHFDELSTSDRVKVKFKFKNRFDGVVQPIIKLLQSNPQLKLVLKVVDNLNLIHALDEILKSKGLRNHCYIQYYFHGFAPMIDRLKGDGFYTKLEELVLLTTASYEAFKNYYVSLPCRVSIMHNGINTDKFYPLNTSDKQALKKENGINNKKIFIWCSQDRPKKGLFLMLDVWKRVYERHQDIELWVIGTKKKENIAGVKFFGKIENALLAKYYQMSDVYLFTTLCQEGFGMSLIEAKHSGCYCIASNMGGVAEVLQFGKYGKLIEHPHMISEWEKAIEEYLAIGESQTSLPENLYSTKEWNQQMHELLANAKKSLQ